MSNLLKCPKCKRFSDPDAAICDCGYSFTDQTYTKPVLPTEQQPLGAWRFISLLVGCCLGLVVGATGQGGGLAVAIAVLIGYHLGDALLTQPLRKAAIPLATRTLVISGVVLLVIAVTAGLVIVVDLTVARSA